MDAFRHDLVYAIRSLFKRPLYAAVTIVVFVIAIGANAAIFGALNAFVFKPLPYPGGERLVEIYNTYPKMGLEKSAVSIPDYIDRRDQAPSLDSVALYTPDRRLLELGDRPEQIAVTRATPSLFDVMRVAPVLGRPFNEDEAVPGREHVAVLSYRLWSTRFGSDPDIVGRDVRVDGETFNVIGVMPESFAFPDKDIDAWVPFAFTPEQTGDDQRGQEFSFSVGRLRPGAAIETLDAEMDAIVQRNVERLSDARAYVETTGFTGRAAPLRESYVGDLDSILFMLQGIALAVLLIACANIANLQLARLASRRTELSVRVALGATSGRLARLVLMESLLLAGLGAVGGVVLCQVALEVLRGADLARMSIGFELTIDTAVLAYTILVMLVAAVATGVLPLILAIRDQPARAVHEGTRGSGGVRAAAGFRNALAVFQIAASAALLIVAGTLGQSFYLLTQQNPGFEPSDVWSARVVLPRGRYDNTSRPVLYSQILDGLAGVPGVEAVGFTSTLPFSGDTSQGSYSIDGFTPANGESPPHANHRIVSDGYFAALGIRVLAGRGFEATEADRVSVVDELFADRYFPGGNAIGQRVAISDGGDLEWYRIVGIVEPVHHDSLADQPTKETLYWHYQQAPSFAGQVVVRSSLAPEQIAAAAGQVIERIDPNVLLNNPMSMENRILDSLGPQLATAILTLVFASGALALAVLGVYGVLSWAVVQRVGEIGIRMALGADSRNIVRMVLERGGRLIVAGLTGGIVLAVLAGRAISAQTFGVSPLDLRIYAVATLVIAGAALLASWIPARRAASVDPMTALRET